MIRPFVELITQRWQITIGVWGLLAVVLTLAAPPWHSVTLDGDFAYLPASAPSVIGQQWLQHAFPHQRYKSQMVVALACEDRAWTVTDYAVAYDIARRMKNLLGAARLNAARRLLADRSNTENRGENATANTGDSRLQDTIRAAADAFQDAAELDDLLAKYNERHRKNAAAPGPPIRRLFEIYHNWALLNELQGDTAQAAKQRRRARQLADHDYGARGQVLPVGAAWLPLLDVWTWRDSYFGDKLTSRDGHARLVLLQLGNEFMAVDNMRVMQIVENQLAAARSAGRLTAGHAPQIALTGSAAVGADLLRSAAASIKNTERITILLVVLILACVYRSPLLIVVPLATIGVALAVSTSLIALLVTLSKTSYFAWLGVTVFSTTRIFIVVILFGAGTDYCLFLIARFKEEIAAGCGPSDAAAKALTHVGDALAGSALTTVVGLGMMYFADFGKYRHSGPVISFCLLITLLVCVTFTPALLAALGRILFWPRAAPRATVTSRGLTGRTRDGAPVQRTVSGRVWDRIARAIVRHPGAVLGSVLIVLLPLAGLGIVRGHKVTFDFLESLPEQSPAKQGAALLRRHFPVGESGPVTVLLRRRGADGAARELNDAIRGFADTLHLPGVAAVRNAQDPLGVLKPGDKVGVLSAAARRIHILRAHPRTRAIFVAQDPKLATTLARFDVITEFDPFSIDAVRCVDRIEQCVLRTTRDPHSMWYGCQYALTGTTAAIRDLRRVTAQDNRRIEILVVGAVLIVLVVILRRLVVCIYMMASVLVSYYVTLGVTHAYFAWQEGAAFQGLDWKTPLFLFVILVAVGQDYNVYLATRVLEEQAKFGPFAGLRRAVIRTGGIITSCGIIMAGTFFSMTGSVWLGWLPKSLGGAPGASLQSIVQLGFALALGILLDTFVVRPILLPAFLALQARRRARVR